MCNWHFTKKVIRGGSLEKKKVCTWDVSRAWAKVEGVCAHILQFGGGVGQQQRCGRCVPPWAGLGIREVACTSARASALGWAWDSDKRGLSGCCEHLAGSSLDPSGHVHRKKCANSFAFIWCVAQLRLANVFRSRFMKISVQWFLKTFYKVLEKKSGVGFFVLLSTDWFHEIHSFQSCHRLWEIQLAKTLR